MTIYAIERSNSGRLTAGQTKSGKFLVKSANENTWEIYVQVFTTPKFDNKIT